MDPLEIHRNILNVVGSRLQDDRTRSVELQYSISPDESLLLGKQRAERIRGYFSTIWDIDASRISIAPKKAIGCGTQFLHNGGAVAMIVSDPGVLSPTVTQWIVDDHVLPNIGLRKRISSKLGVMEWDLVITQHDRQIAHITQDDFTGGEINAVLPLAPMVVDTIPDPLVAELTVIDYSDSHDTTSDEIALQMSPARTEPSREIRIFYFLEPWSTCPTVIAGNRALVDKIATSTGNGARVTISGEPWSTGVAWGPGQVAQEILAALNAHSIRPAQFHMEQQRVLTDSSGLPEEELFRHIVKVTVEQAVGDDNSSTGRRDVRGGQVENKTAISPTHKR
jgi:hypothetical protein